MLLLSIAFLSIPQLSVKNHFFFLSAQEAYTYFDADVIDHEDTHSNSDRIAKDDYGYEASWWLRSPYVESYNNLVGRVSKTGVISYNDVAVPYAISGTHKTDNTKVYALVTDKSGAKVLQYTALTTGSDGTGSFDLDTSIVTIANGTWGTDYHVYILAVNEGGEKRTDCASAPREIHAHDWSYDPVTWDHAETITATCSNGGCDANGSAQLTICAPANLTCDGSSKAATISGNTAALGTPEIVYTKDDQPFAQTPTDVGAYTASITLGTGSGAATARVAFAITQATPEIATGPSASGITYGQALEDSAISGVMKCGDATVEGVFSWDDRSVVPAVSDSGKTEYAWTFTPTSDNYTKRTGKLTLTVAKAAATLNTAPTPLNATYTGQAQALALAGFASGGKLAYSTDGTNYGEAGDTQDLGAKVALSPTNANAALTWTSSDPAVASVDASGVVTAHRKGRVVITVTSQNGKKAKVKIKVK